MTLPNPIDMEAFENAIQSWFSESIEAEAIWTNQSAPRPTEYPYGTLNITAGPVLYSQILERRSDTDLTRDAGKEVRFQVGVPCWFDVSCQVLVKVPESRYPDAHSLLTRACFNLGLTEYSDALKDDNIASIRVDPILNPGSLINDAYVARAAATVAFSTTLSIEEYTGYWKTVDIKSTQMGIDQKIGVL